MHLDREAYEWLECQISRLSSLRVSEDELAWLEKTCTYLTPEYLHFLRDFRFNPDEHVDISFKAIDSDHGPQQRGDIELRVRGRWLDTILYEIPLLALVSEAYFKFIDTDWEYTGQEEAAKQKTQKLLETGCVFSEFGSRRRRDLKTQDLIVRGIIAAREEAERCGHTGKVAGTSNVHLAMKYGLAPVGTVAHEWFMGIAAITNDYRNANETGLRYWIATFGRGTLSIALTDTFGTPDFLRAFAKPAPPSHSTDPLAAGPLQRTTYAQLFTGTRQDSGDPLAFVQTMKTFYAEQGIHEPKTVIFSDSLDVDKCIKYKEAAREAGLNASFGIGTHFTNDFKRKSDGEKSVPMNIVIKIERADGRLAVKLSDNLGKNTGDSEEVARAKRELGYHEQSWEGVSETNRW